MRLNDLTPHLRERDELLAHLVDDGTISAEAARRERCRERGICSEPDCEQPIDGWCDECGAKLCNGCLLWHELGGALYVHPGALTRLHAREAAERSGE